METRRAERKAAALAADTHRPQPAGNRQVHGRRRDRYFGDTFGRPWPNHDEVITLEEFDNDPQADWFATETQTSTSIVDLYHRVWDFADETFASLPLDAIGAVPHWPADRNTVTLAQMMTHVLVDLTRHLGQADVIREAIDGQVGLNATNPNMPEDQNWDAYLAKLRRLADNA